MTDQHMAARSDVGGNATKTMTICPGTGRQLVDGRCPVCRSICKPWRKAGEAIDSAGLAARHRKPAWLEAREGE